MICPYLKTRKGNLIKVYKKLVTKRQEKGMNRKESNLNEENKKNKSVSISYIYEQDEVDNIERDK